MVIWNLIQLCWIHSQVRKCYLEVACTAELSLDVLPDLLLDQLRYLVSALCRVQKPFVGVIPYIRNKGINDSAKVAVVNVVYQISV